MLKVGQFVWVNMSLHSILVYDSNKIANVLYNKFMTRVSDPYEIVTFCDNIPTILGDGSENTISIDSTARAPGFDRNNYESTDKKPPEETRSDLT